MATWHILKQGVQAWNQWRKEHPDHAIRLYDTDLHDADLRGANFGGTHFSGSDLSGAKLHRANFVGAYLGGVNLSKAELDGANLRKAHLFEARLPGAQIRSADLTKSDLRETDLRASNLSWAHLNGADLSNAKLDGANLSWADLPGANFSGANLSDASLSGADLSGAILQRTILSRADLSHAFLLGTIFGSVDLSAVKGLATVRHEGPSIIDIDTIYRSKGKIPAIFLRGAGVPDNFIEYMHSLTGNAFEFYSCFISYTSNDQEFAERLHADLQANGVRCWFAPHDIQGGKKLHEQIDSAIRVHERLLLILSPDSIHSEWVKTEIDKARAREVTEKRQMLFPVSLRLSFEELKKWQAFDADIGRDSAKEIREYYIPDFTGWKDHDSYQKELNRLLRDLKKA
jgi:uncharacterized protein YjbI with pentapeptide repeats